MVNSFNQKILKYNNINDMLIKEKNYLHIIMGYCESKMDCCETAAEIYMIMSELNMLHEKLFNDVDNIIIELGR